MPLIGHAMSIGFTSSHPRIHGPARGLVDEGRPDHHRIRDSIERGIPTVRAIACWIAGGAAPL
jgi:hypothetical protein